MEAYVKVDSCPEEPRLWMKNNQEEDYDDGLDDSDMDVVRFDGDSVPAPPPQPLCRHFLWVCRQREKMAALGEPVRLERGEWGRAWDGRGRRR